MSSSIGEGDKRFIAVQAHLIMLVEKWRSQAFMLSTFADELAAVLSGDFIMMKQFVNEISDSLDEEESGKDDEMDTSHPYRGPRRTMRDHLHGDR